MSAGRQCRICDNGTLEIFEEIPSGFDSEIEDDEEEGTDEDQLPAQVDYPEPIAEIDLFDWESEDELPLSVVRARECESSTVWTKDNRFSDTQIQDFVEETGPNIPDGAEMPVDIFLHLFPQELIDLIVFQTNLYATQKSGGRNTSFTFTNSNEIKTFLAVNILMGIKPLPSYRDYWSSKLEIRDHYISSLLSRNRFDWLLGNIHFNDNFQQPPRNSPDFDKLYKIRPLLEKLTSTFLSSYKPSKNQAIDESMIKFKGRCSIRQYMPMKPIKRGYKLWVRANESGYVSEFQIYTGKISDAPEKNLGARVVKDLTSNLFGKRHHVFFDNFFNSVDLQKHLKRQLVYSCGTVRSNRKHLPTGLMEDKKMEKGDSDWRVSKDGLAFVKWKDTKAVHVLGNSHDPSVNSTTLRMQKDGNRKEISCPDIVLRYNKNMGFVDKADMLKSCYEIDRKSKKWWHRIMWHFIDVCVVNSHILFKERGDGSSLSLKEFRLALVNGLVGASDLSDDRRCRNSISRTPIKSNFKVRVPLEKRYDQCAHLPTHGTARRCAHCSTKRIPHRTKWSCTSCKVALCLSAEKNCFIEFHTK